MSVIGICHIPYRVRDIGATIDFFTEMFGFNLLRRWVAADGWEGAYLEMGNVLLEVNKIEDEALLPGDKLVRILGLTVTDLDETLRQLKAKGVKVGIEPFEPRTFWGRQAGVFDPSGYIISLREWRAPDGPKYPDWQPRDDTKRTA
jgi:predicted enzyme related to lactoylglutathione lyase